MIESTIRTKIEEAKNAKSCTGIGTPMGWTDFQDGYNYAIASQEDWLYNLLRRVLEREDKHKEEIQRLQDKLSLLEFQLEFNGADLNFGVDEDEH